MYLLRARKGGDHVSRKACEEIWGEEVRPPDGYGGLAGALVLSLAVPAALAGVPSQSNGGKKGYVTTDACPESGSLEDNVILTKDDILGVVPETR
jgi:hypothetical protein